MGLRSTIAAAVKSSFVAVGDIKTAMTFRASSSPTTYNESTGIYARVDSDTTLDAILTDFEQSEIDGIKIEPTDRKVLIDAADLSNDPTIEDRIIIETKEFRIVNWKKDPSESLYTIQVRL